MGKKQFRGLSFFLVLALVLAGFSGFVGSADALAPQADPVVNVAHFAPFADSLVGTSVTVKVDGVDALTDFQFGDIAAGVSLPPGEHLIEIVPTGTSTVAISGTVDLAADTTYTLAAIGNGSLQPLELFPLVDDTMAPVSGAKLRVGHLAPFAANLMDTEVDICTDDGTVVLDNVPYKAVTGYLPFPAGDYDLLIAAPDDTCSTVFLDIPSVRLADGGVYDVFAIGDLINQDLQIASVTGITPTPPAIVNVAHFASFADSLAGTSVTVKVNGADALTDFQFGDIAPGVELPAGSYLIEIVPTGTSTVAISGTVDLAADTTYTLAAIGNGSLQPLELFALVDDTMAPAEGGKVRVAHLAPFADTLAATEVDICFDEGGVAAGLAGIPYKGYTMDYLELPAGTYDLQITAAGSDCGTVLIDIPIFDLQDGEVGTLYAIGDGVNFAPQILSFPDIIFDYINYFSLIFG